MTSVRIHGILAREYGDFFNLSLPNPKDVLEAIDCNKVGFIRRLIQLQKEGCCYDIIINKQKITSGKQMDNFKNPETIDIVPAISGAGFIGAIFSLFTGSTLLAVIAKAVLFAAIAYALTPKPEIEALEITADASKSSLIFTNVANVASQGAPVPIGYGRLKVGSQVVQATIKSFPQSQTPQQVLTRQSYIESSERGNWPFIGNKTNNYYD